jgi:two-component system phosphate regulon sensor histidine kinase PhoR
MPRIDLSWDQLYASAISPQRQELTVPLFEMIFARNIRWFIALRWIAVAVLSSVILLANLCKNQLSNAGINAPGLWYFAIIFILSMTNLMLSGRRAQKHLTPVANIWIQIIVDLFCLSWVVHFCGSVGTPAPFLYVLHISLACIFFDLRLSLLVTVVASLLYASCIAAETAGFLQPSSVFPLSDGIPGTYAVLSGITMTGLLFLVWYITSRLSKIILVSESMLLKAHENSRLARQERARHALQMTHQLKSPLDAVESYLQLMEADLGETATPKTKRLIKKIVAKLSGMRALVLDVLQLSRLDPETEQSAMEVANIGRIVRKCVDDMKPKAAQRGISLKSTIEDVVFECYASQIQVLIANLLSNAINYSYDGGTVHIGIRRIDDRDEAELSVEDTGIGIDPEKLPRIFEPYFRTKEAALHNANSTGIGLTIVSRIVKTHAINISVKSEVNRGTTFTLVFPHVHRGAPGTKTDVIKRTQPSSIESQTPPTTNKSAGAA